MAVNQVRLAWSASSDDTRVSAYNVYRGRAPGFVPSSANRVAAVTGATSFNDTALAPGDYYYRVTAEDAAHNVSAASAETHGRATAEAIPPVVAVTSPLPPAAVSGTVPVTALASDTSGIGGVLFKVDGQNLGVEDTTAPYSASWDTTAVPDGEHTVTAVARDLVGNRTTSVPVVAIVDNHPGGPPPPQEPPVTTPPTDPPTPTPAPDLPPPSAGRFRMRLASPSWIAVCKHPQRSCPASAPVRLWTSARAKLAFRVLRHGRSGWKRVSRSERSVGRGYSVIRLSARGARTGRYLVRVRASGVRGGSAEVEVRMTVAATAREATARRVTRAQKHLRRRSR